MTCLVFLIAVVLISLISFGIATDGVISRCIPGLVIWLAVALVELWHRISGE